VNALSDAPDVCIIGAGLAGGLVAFELARRGVSVVVLEAGARHDAARRAADLEIALAGGNPWAGDPRRDAYTNAGSYAYPLNEMRVKAVGGTTLHWTALTHRLLESDFALRRRCGLAADWPINYAELEPHYDRAEQLLGVSGADDNPFAAPRRSAYPLPAFPFSYADERVRGAAEKLKIAFHHAPFARGTIAYAGRPACLAFGTCASHHVCPITAQYTAETHIRLAEATGHARVEPGARAVRLETGASERLRHVVYVDGDGKWREQPARVFVLAAHAVESARLLLLSRSSRFPGGLANRSDMVGRHFMEHPMIYAQAAVRENLYPYRIGFHTAESQQFCDPAERGAAAGFRLSLANQVGPMPAELATHSGQWGATLRDEVRAQFGRVAGILAFLEQLPDPENRVTLDRAVVDDLGDPVPCITFGVGEYVRAGQRRANDVMTSILSAFGAYDISLAAEGQFSMCGHQLGTSRMGDDPATSVVDRNLRAHDVPNLFVVGSGPFVTAGPLNPSLTIAALAVRLAEFLAANGAS